MVRRVLGLSGISLSVVLGFVACSEEAPPSVDGVGDTVYEPMGRDLPDEQTMFGPDGVPLESEERMAGLVLPRGLTEIEPLREERVRVYSSKIPPRSLLRYFGPRLTTVQIDRQGDRVTYREAIPRGVRGGAVKIDVSIFPTPAEASRVEIREVVPPPPAGTVIPEEEIRRHLDSLGEHRE